jgi:hypothetical protein
MYYDLQKIFTFDYIEYVRWTEQIKYRVTFCGLFAYYIGKIVAIFYLVQICFSAKNIIHPVYSSDRITVYVYKTLQFLDIEQQ